ncbi:GPP34 family phosphoprotein [Streptomyces sp. NPDC012421]|uniref:GOLPH3/VPS74 family protein n=1 Tax=Streptomyces sp. NPDC012421 TaxID=3364832 RepID=UPI0036E96CDD
MTTAKDLFLIAMDSRQKQAVGQGDLSLALAGAELIDLLGAGALTLEDDVLVPGGTSAPDNRLLGEAGARIVRQAPYESVEDWLWRRGKDLAAAYQTALEADGELTPRTAGRLSFGARRVEAVDTPARHEAVDRWERREPVLTALASIVGIGGEPSDEELELDDDAATAVVAAVHDAVMELEAVRQRRTIENAAFANLWRGP